jgi:hypothetical protein
LNDHWSDDNWVYGLKEGGYRGWRCDTITELTPKDIHWSLEDSWMIIGGSRRKKSPEMVHWSLQDPWMFIGVLITAEEGGI